jgi:Riboflavin synthase beta-chain
MLSLCSIGFGILTCYDLEQAIIRSDVNQKNKGKEATLACIELLK